MIEDKDEQMGTHNYNFITKAKLAVYSAFYHQTKARSINLITAIILISLNFLQLISTYFESSSLYIFNDGLFKYVRGLSNVLLIAPSVSNNYTTYAATAYMYLAIDILDLACLLYVSYHSYHGTKPFFHMPLKILYILNLLFQWVLFIPGIQLFSMTYKCPKQNCWGPLHIGNIVAFSIGFILHFFIGILAYSLYNTSQSLSHDAFSRVDNNIELFVCVYEAVIAVVTLYTNPTKYRYIGLIMHALGGAYILKLYYQLLPYYNSTISFVYGGCCSSYVWITLNVCLSEALKNQDYGGQSIVILLGIIIIFPLTKNIRERILLIKVFNKRHDKLKDVNELDLYLREIRNLLAIKSVDAFSDMILLGYITNHKSECSNPECPINNNDKLYLPLTNAFSDSTSQNDNIHTIYVINSIYSEFSHSSQSNALFHYIYSDFLLSVIGNTHMALVELFLAEKGCPGKQLEFSIYKIKRMIETELNEMNIKQKKNSKQSLLIMDPTVVMEFEELFHVFQKRIEKNAGEHVEFWQQLESMVPDLNLIHKSGSIILQSTLDLHKLWDKLSKINSNYHKALWLYGLYLSEIKNDRKEGEQMLDKARQIKLSKVIEKNISDFDTMFSDDTSLIIISGDKDSQGIIRQVSLGTTKLFGYKTYDLMGHDVSQLMPSLISKNHSEYLSSYFKTGMKRIIGIDNHTYALNKQNHVLSISLIVKPVPSLKCGIQYIGVIRQIYKEFEFIIVGNNGLIDCISPGIEMILSPINHLLIQQYDFYIHFICPDLLDVLNEKALTKFELFKGINRLTFMLPKDLQTILHSIGKSREKDISYANSDESYISLNDSINKKPINLLPKLLARWQNIHTETDGNRTSKNFLKQKINYAISKKITLDVEIIDMSHTKANFKVIKILNKGKKGSISSEDQNDNIQSIWVNDGSKAIKNIGVVSDALNRMSAAIKQSSSKLKTDSDLEEGTKGKESREESKDLPPPIMPLNLRPEGNNDSIISLMNVITFQKTETTSESKSIDQSKAGYSPLVRPMHLQVEQRNEFRREPTGTTLHLSAMDDFKKMPNNQMVDKPFIPEFTTITTISQNFHEESMADIGLIDKKDRRNEEQKSSHDSRRSMKQGAKGKERKGTHQFNPDNGSLVESSIDISAAPFNRNSTHGGSISSVDEEDDEGFFGNLKKNYEQKNTFNDGDANSSNDQAPSGIKRDVDQNTEGSMSSNDASSTRSVMKQLKNLTKSMYTSVTPSSVRNLQVLAYIIFILIVSATFINFFIGRSLYQNLRGNVSLLKSAQIRQTSTVYISSAITELILINLTKLNYTARGNLFNEIEPPADSSNIIYDYQQWLNESLWVYSCNLRDAQGIIGMVSDTVNESSNSLINSNSVMLNYGSSSSELGSIHEVDSWTAIMALVLHTQNVRATGILSSVAESIKFISSNSLNSIMNNINGTIDALSTQNWHTATKGKKILQILLIVSTIVLIIALAILIPVIMMIGNNTEEVLMLFLQIGMGKIREELEKCKRFYNAFKGNYEKLGEDEDEVDNPPTPKNESPKHKKQSPRNSPNEEKKDPKKESAFSPKKEEKAKDQKQGGTEETPMNQKINEVKKELIDYDDEDIGIRRQRKYRPFSKSIGQNIAKFLISMALLESYFIFCYFKSTIFYDKIVSIIDEMGIINTRLFSNAYLYISEFEMLSSNSTTQIQGINSVAFVEYYSEKMIDEQERFLKAHSDNLNRNQRVYNTYFDDLIYKNVCDQVKQNQSTFEVDCVGYMGGILQKGLHSANVAYWDNLREKLNEFKKREYKSINDASLMQLKLLECKFLEPSYRELNNRIENSIDSSFNSENMLLVIVFIVFIAVVILVFMVLWRAFIFTTRKSLFMTKTMVAIIPPEVIFQTRKIRDYVLKSSRQVVYQVK